MNDKIEVNKIKILLVCNNISTFIQNDLNILEKYYEVKLVDFNKKTLLYLLKSIVKLFKGVLWSDITYSWFANIHALLAVLLSKLFRRKSIVVAGGYDTANEPEIKYGMFLNPIFKRIAKNTFKYSNIVIPFSINADNELIKNYNFKKVKIVVYCGVNINKFYPKGCKDNKLVITVGNVNYGNLSRKGLLNFVKSARYLPEIIFLLIGKHSDDSILYLKSIATSNVKFTGFATSNDLIKYMQKAKVYVQLSYHEGFGLSLAEAMLCECVPVVSKKGALPEVVGDTGFYVEELTPEETAEKIKLALNSDLGKMSRERIISNFSLEKRENQLIKIISEL